MLHRASPGLPCQLMLRLPAGVSRQQFACASFEHEEKKKKEALSGDTVGATAAGCTHPS